MKKNIVRLSAIAVLCLSANQATAAGNSVELKVKGNITPPACELRLSANEVRLGKIAPSRIQANEVTKLDKVNPVGIFASCDGVTSLTLSIVDNRMATASTPSASHFGLGSVNGNGKLGYYRINMKSGNVDGKPAQLFAKPKASTSFTPVSEVELATDKDMGWSQGGDNKPAMGRFFSSDLEIIPYLASAKDMGGSVPDGTQLDGSATLSMVYGL